VVVVVARCDQKHKKVYPATHGSTLPAGGTGPTATTSNNLGGSAQGVDVAHQTAFQVGCFIAVDVAAFCQTVDHADNLWKKGFCFRFIFQVAQIFDCGTRCLFVVAVLQTTLFGLTDALEGRLMMCHIITESLIRLKINSLKLNSLLFATFNSGGKGKILSVKRKKERHFYFVYSFLYVLFGLTLNLRTFFKQGICERPIFAGFYAIA
jgi:hypothetical protein